MTAVSVPSFLSNCRALVLVCCLTNNGSDGESEQQDMLCGTQDCSTCKFNVDTLHAIGAKSLKAMHEYPVHSQSCSMLYMLWPAMLLEHAECESESSALSLHSQELSALGQQSSWVGQPYCNMTMSTTCGKDQITSLAALEVIEPATHAAT